MAQNCKFIHVDDLLIVVTKYDVQIHKTKLIDKIELESKESEK